MGNLIRANFRTLRSNRLLLICIVIFVFIIASDVSFFWDLRDKYDSLNVLTNSSMTVVIAVGCIVPFIVGADFEGGMIRNKIMAGYSKFQIYIASFITSLVVTEIFTIFTVVMSVKEIVDSVGVSRFVRWFGDSNYKAVFVHIIIWYLAICLAYTALSTALIMISENKAISIVGLISVVLVFSITTGSLRRFATDTEKEFVSINEQNELIIESNPYYVAPDDPMKKVYVTIDSLDVVGQVVFTPEQEVFDENDMNDKGHYELSSRYALGSVAMTILLTALGLVVFKRRNLK